jgi:hypothetical protein
MAPSAPAGPRDRHPRPSRAGLTSPARGRSGYKALHALAGCLLLTSLVSVPVRAQTSAPLYRLDVRVDTESHRLLGSIRVELNAEDPRAGDVWWFRLPPNRFLERDPRGDRRRTDSVPFGFDYTRSVAQDQFLPAGFSEGRIRILSVEDGRGKPLEFGFEDNPLIPVGFSARRELLRVRFLPDSPCCQVLIRFVTQLPNRHWDGWSDVGILTENGFPALLPHRDGDWVRDPAEPSPARCSGKFQTDRKGWLILAGMAPQRVDRGGVTEVPESVAPSRSCLLAFVPAVKSAITERHGVVIASLFQSGNERVGGLLLDIAEGFLEFMEVHYGMTYPKQQLTFVQLDLPNGDILASDGAILLPSVDYKNSPVLDRVLVGRVSRAIAQQWFGETVLLNEDRDAWMIWGLSGYLALEYFDFLYGWDGPTHAITDWLAPRYREHYFEEPVRGLVRGELDPPLAISLWKHSLSYMARVAVHHKAPLVLRQLEHVVGNATFHGAVRRFAETYAGRRAGPGDLQSTVETEAGEDLDWYYRDWVRGTTGLDVELRGVEQEPADGGYDVDIGIRRHEAPRMPVEVLVSTESGEDITTRWEGIEPETTLRVHTSSPVSRVVLDPREHLMETDRQNNYSESNVRVRPFFDWSKNREVLVSLRGTAGGNAIDGNFVMLGARVDLDPENQLHIIPGYGQDSEEAIYDVGWTRKRLFTPRLDLTLRRTRIGGRDFFGAALAYHHRTPERVTWDSTIEFRREHVDAPPENGEIPIGLQSPGQVNNVNLLESAALDPSGPTYHNLEIELERSQPGWHSDFEYTLARGEWLNGFELAYDHIVELALIRGEIDGDAPVQKKLLLGDPLVLRGYPRTVDLVFDHIAVARLDYRYVFSRAIRGRELQTRKVTGILFGDLGKGWNNGESARNQPQRQDLGAGIEIELELVNQVRFPIRVEVAQPYNDPQYRRTQFIFFQALAFF